MKQIPITESDLQAYVDAALPAARRAEVDDYLASRPQDAERIRSYMAQKLSLRTLFNPVLDEPLPEHLSALASPPAAAAETPARAAASRWSLQRLAAGILLVLVSGLVGWVAHDQVAPAAGIAAGSPFSHQAAVAHAVFSPDMRRPVEVSAEHQDQLVAWLSKRLGTRVSPPQLGTLGYDLIGGRLLPGDSGPVAQFMYQDATGQRLTLYVSTENTRNQDTAFRFAQEGPVNVFYWIDGKFGYALSAEIDKNSLSRIATAVYDQIEKAGASRARPQ